jgi:hypothetical protein
MRGECNGDGPKCIAPTVPIAAQHVPVGFKHGEERARHTEQKRRIGGQRLVDELIGAVPVGEDVLIETLLTETCRSLFRTLPYPQILLKTVFKIGERQVSHLSLAQIA